MKEILQFKLLIGVSLFGICLSGCSAKNVENKDIVESRLLGVEQEFKEKYSEKTEYDTYIEDGFSEKYANIMNEDVIRFESHIFDGKSGAEYKSIENDDGGYILTYVYGINENEYTPTDGETMPVQGTVVEPKWNIGVLTYNTAQETSEITYYEGMYYDYFYVDEYTCRKLYDKQGNEFLLFGYK